MRRKRGHVTGKLSPSVCATTTHPFRHKSFAPLAASPPVAWSIIDSSTMFSRSCAGPTDTVHGAA